MSCAATCPGAVGASSRSGCAGGAEGSDGRGAVKTMSLPPPAWPVLACGGGGGGGVGIVRVDIAQNLRAAGARAAC
jgi:hypothetical protein